MAQILQLMVVNQSGGRGGLEDEMLGKEGKRTEIGMGNRNKNGTGMEERKKKERAPEKERRRERAKGGVNVRYSRNQAVPVKLGKISQFVRFHRGQDIESREYVGSDCTYKVVDTRTTSPNEYPINEDIMFA